MPNRAGNASDELKWDAFVCEQGLFSGSWPVEELPHWPKTHSSGRKHTRSILLEIPTLFGELSPVGPVTGSDGQTRHRAALQAPRSVMISGSFRRSSDVAWASRPESSHLFLFFL